MTVPVHFKHTDYGFEYGAAIVERIAAFGRPGHGSVVVLRLGTTKEPYRFTISVRGTGKVEIKDDHEGGGA